MPGTEGHYIPGERYIECDICGFTYRFSEMSKGIAKGQKGYNVCPEDFDSPHPRDIPVKLRKKDPLEQVK